MNWLDAFFIAPQEQQNYITGSYDYTLVTLSVIVAAVASFIALHFASMAQSMLVERQRHIAVITGACIMAAGVWSMHFVGMLAHDIGGHVGYDLTLTFVSVIPSLIATYITLKILMKARLTFWQLVYGSLIVGAGIGMMHYTGMEAMEMEAKLQYVPTWFFASIVVAVVLAFVALSVRYYLSQFTQNLSANLINAISAIIMGIAISGMHYTGMAGARFSDIDVTVIHQAMNQEHQQLSYIVAFTTLIISALAATIASQLRYRQLLVEKTSNERRLQTMMNTAVDGIFTIDSNGIIQDFNQSATDIFGWQPSDIIGQSFFRLVPDEAIEEFRGYLLNFQKTGQTQISGQAREVFAKHKDGHIFPVRLGLGHIQLKEQDSMFVSFVTDISERWEMQEKLRKSEAQYSSLIKNIPGASFRCLLDEQWTAVLVSDAIFDLCGWHPEDFYQGRIHFYDLIHPDDVEKTDQAVAQALESKSNYTVEFRWKHRAGHYIWVLENGSVIWEDDKPLWIDGLILDISERVQMEHNLIEAKEAAELSAESKARFLANMSHEIRTPMNAIIGFTDILNDADSLSVEDKKHLKTISQSARSLMHLLNDVLDSAKLEKDKLELDESAFHLTRLVDSVVSTLWLQAKNKGLYLNFEIPSDIHPSYIGDEGRLRQVLINLVGNAIKFTEKGGVKLSVSSNPQQQLRFVIEDTGIGMDASTLAQVFEPFSQADASMSRRFGGTGLGTTISKQLVELMGGELYAKSELGVGSVFYFELPLQKTDVVIEPVSEGKPLSLPPQTVLIADDIEQNLTLLTLLLERQHHKTVQAENGEHALALVKEIRPDIVLMDLQMPVMDGFTATKLIRDYEAENDLSPTPVVALTASVLSEDKMEAKRAGMNGFAHKPVDIHALTREMAKVLGISIADDDIEPETVVDDHSGQINLQQGLDLWGSHATYVEELSRFLNQHADLPAQLLNLAAASDFAALKADSHRLKGLSGNLGLTAIYQISISLEQQAGNSDSEQCSEEIKALQEAMSALALEVKALAELHQLEQTTSRQSQTLTESDTLDLVEQLSTLTGLGEMDESMVDKLVNGIKADLHSLAQGLQNALDEFDFVTAQHHLDSIKQQLTKG